MGVKAHLTFVDPSAKSTFVGFVITTGPIFAYVWPALVVSSVSLTHRLKRHPPKTAWAHPTSHKIRITEVAFYSTLLPNRQAIYESTLG